MKNKGLLILAVIAAVLLLSKGCSGNDSELNRIGSSIDWGDNYYWNRSTESVERIPWK